ncbi:MAG: hypothetical protein FJ104_04770 [Deltaproteobacteria bacterium]|nr:hypothetical protein [Deltaproteobacteria bacterium]
MTYPHGLRFLPLCVLPLVACSEGTVVSSDYGADAGGGAGGGGGGTGGGPQVLPDGGVVIPGGRAKGDDCTPGGGAEDCRAGLACTSGTCELAGTTPAGSPCVAAGECEDGLSCLLGKCAPAGAAVEGEGCGSDADCADGLRCGIVGFGAQCVPEGGSDVGQGCGISADCLAGLLCAPAQADAGGAAGACAPVPPTGPSAGISFGIPTAPRLECEAESEGKVKAHFEVPGAEGTDPNGDFFRLPFPNDARIRSGKLDLSGFPTPGSFLLGFDPVQVYLDALTENEDAWGTYPTVLFRFSGPIEFDTFRSQPGEPSPVQYLDITDPAAPGNGGSAWAWSPGGGKYICHNWLGVRRPDGAPLEPGHTYVVYLSTAGRSKSGLTIERSPQLAQLLQNASPIDPALTQAHGRYKPFRDYLAAAGISPDEILNASVFTTAPVRDRMKDLAAAAAAGPAPALSSEWVKCAAGVTSPCSDATGSRACGAPAADYDEYHAVLRIPVYQQGTAPYTAAGGGIDPARARDEDVCVALSVPKGAPATDVPLVVYGHGTGGSFRSHLRDEVAGALARATPKLAVLGYDAVQHGPRRNGSTASPNVLFFNFKNPDAARGNPLQGAADVVSVGRFARGLVLPGSATGAGDIAFDPDTLTYYGHSQGSMHGSLALPYTGDYVATVLSGNGASLMHALLTKTKPENIAAAVPFALGGDFDPPRAGKPGFTLYGDVNHPVLTILQQWIDPADPLNFARVIAREAAVDGMLPKSVLQTYGLGDTYSPPVTMKTYALAADLPLAEHDSSVGTPDDWNGKVTTSLPLSENFARDGRAVTLAVRQYENASGKDGHFVATDVAGARSDVVRFLTTAVTDPAPVVGQ